MDGRPGPGGVAPRRLLERADGVAVLQPFCGYPINVGPEFQASEVDGVLCAHTHFVPADADFETAIDLAIADVLGPTADSVRLLLKSAFPSWETLPRAEVAVLWLRRNLPEYVDALLDRAGRHVAEASG